MWWITINKVHQNLDIRKEFQNFEKKKKILQDISQMTSNMAHTKRGEVLPENIWLTKVAPHTELNLLS